MDNRFRHPPKAPADVAGIVKELIGDGTAIGRLLRNDDLLSQIGVTPSVICELEAGVTETLRTEGHLPATSDYLIVGTNVDTVGALIAEFEKAFARANQIAEPQP